MAAVRGGLVGRWWLGPLSIRGYMVSALSDPGGVVIGDDTDQKRVTAVSPSSPWPDCPSPAPHRRDPRRQSKSMGRVTTSANEIRRLFAAYSPPPDEEHTRHCSQWRHRHEQHAVIAIINYNASKSTKRCGSAPTHRRCVGNRIGCCRL